jgi:hypothetical protein
MSEAIERLRLRKVAHLGIEEIEDVSHLRAILHVIVTGKLPAPPQRTKTTRAKPQKKDNVRLGVVS